MSMKTPLVSVPEYLESPRHCEDEGKLSPTSEESRKSQVAKAFPIGKSSHGAGSKVSIPHSVDFESGQIVPNVKGDR